MKSETPQTWRHFENKASLHCFSMGLEFGVVPVSWKVANIIPVFKKRKKEHALSYRPVSLQCLAKLWRRLFGS